VRCGFYAIYVEQQSRDLFNLALSRNLAARAALDDGASGPFVFHDVDIIPLRGVDYRPRSFNVAWFLSAGSCKVMAADFVSANRYNPNVVVSGDEDVEFYHRLEHVGCEVKEWHRTAESRQDSRVPAGGRRKPRMAGDVRRGGAFVVSALLRGRELRASVRPL
jgi:hypothetical protein